MFKSILVDDDISFDIIANNKKKKVIAEKKNVVMSFESKNTSTEISSHGKRTRISVLPRELFFEIFTFLRYPIILSTLPKVCKLFLEVVQDEVFFRILCKIYLVKKKMIRKRKQKSNAFAVSRGNSVPSFQPTPPPARVLGRILNQIALPKITRPTPIFDDLNEVKLEQQSWKSLFLKYTPPVYVDIMTCLSGDREIINFSLGFLNERSSVMNKGKRFELDDFDLVVITKKNEVVVTYEKHGGVSKKHKEVSGGVSEIKVTFSNFFRVREGKNEPEDNTSINKNSTTDLLLQPRPILGLQLQNDGTKKEGKPKSNFTVAYSRNNITFESFPPTPEEIDIRKKIMKSVPPNIYFPLSFHLFFTPPPTREKVDVEIGKLKPSYFNLRQDRTVINDPRELVERLSISDVVSDSFTPFEVEVDPSLSSVIVLSKNRIKMFGFEIDNEEKKTSMFRFGKLKNVNLVHPRSFYGPSRNTLPFVRMNEMIPSFSDVLEYRCVNFVFCPRFEDLGILEVKKMLNKLKSINMK